jgi:hypothetical protein
MAYAYPSDASLDYFLCHYGKSKLLFRGPKQSLARPYFAALGGTETYGKFLENPYPSALGELAEVSVVNLGIMNAGVDVYLNDPDIIDIASDASLCIVQIVGAQNLTNSFYAVHPRRNDRFLRANPRLQAMYREVDFTEFHFTRHMLQTLYQVSPHRFVEVAAELQSIWITRMRHLLQSIKAPTLVLWMADKQPQKAKPSQSPYDDPVLINAAMIEQVRGYANGYLEVVTSPTAKGEGIEDMAFSSLERPAAEGVPGPLAHREVAEAISDAMGRILGKP